jgi:hypothetical protein
MCRKKQSGIEIANISFRHFLVVWPLNTILWRAASDGYTKGMEPVGDKYFYLT